MQSCGPVLATEVKGAKTVPIISNTTPAIFNNKVFFMYFSPLLDRSYLTNTVVSIVQIKVEYDQPLEIRQRAQSG
jgi:hypothetical protein